MTTTAASSLRPIGVGVIGFGLMGRVHVQAYASAARDGHANRLWAICDRRAERFAADAHEGGNLQQGAAGPLFDPELVATGVDPESVFAHPSIDLVSICTPTDTHVELAERALEAGKHVLLEKPVALDVADIERLEHVARRVRRICMPAMCMRFWPGWSWLMQATRDRRFGALKSLVLQRCGARPSWGREFYGDRTRSGGALFDLHVHDADLVLQLCGTPDAVFSTGNDDHVTTLYRFARGPAHVVAEGGWDHAEAFAFRMRYVAVFERATAEFDLRRVHPLELMRDGIVETIALEPGTGYDGEVRAILAAVGGDASIELPTLGEAAAVTRLLIRERAALST